MASIPALESAVRCAELPPTGAKPLIVSPSRKSGAQRSGTVVAVAPTATLASGGGTGPSSAQPTATPDDRVDVEDRLGRQPSLAGQATTEAVWRLFTTLVRFDPVYVGHFKCNLRRIADYPNLARYMRELYRVPGVAETVNFDHIKRHYYQSHRNINPTGIVPSGPVLALP